MRAARFHSKEKATHCPVPRHTRREAGRGEGKERRGGSRRERGIEAPIPPPPLRLCLKLLSVVFLRFLPGRPPRAAVARGVCVVVDVVVAEWLTAGSPRCTRPYLERKRKGGKTSKQTKKLLCACMRFGRDAPQSSFSPCRIMFLCAGMCVVPSIVAVLNYCSVRFGVVFSCLPSTLPLSLPESQRGRRTRAHCSARQM